MAAYSSNTTLKPYILQAFSTTLGQWVTDCSLDSLDEARIKADRLFLDFQRRVRVIDQEERVLYAAGKPQRVFKVTTE